MNCKTLAEMLLKTPDAIPMVSVGADWCEVAAVVSTGQRNSVGITACNPVLSGGVIEAGQQWQEAGYFQPK